MKKLKVEAGFTLIEILVVIGLIAILAAVVIIAINPSRQFAQGRNSQRTSNVNAILNAIGQNIADNKGTFTCSAPLDAAARTIKNGSGADVTDLRGCLVPTYLPEIVFDPDASSGAHFTAASDYDTEYAVTKDASTSRITVMAPHAELNQTIAVTR